MDALTASAYTHDNRHICCTAEDACLVPGADMLGMSRQLPANR